MQHTHSNIITRFKKWLAISLVVAVFCLTGTSTLAQFEYGNSISRVPEPGVWVAQNDRRDNYRSKSDVMREVKRRYDARVLKISLNEKHGVYRVRLLMPNGKVRNITVSATR